MGEAEGEFHFSVLLTCDSQWICTRSVCRLQGRDLDCFSFI